MLRIGGLTPFTTIDYPDHLAAVVFCQGCPWRCRYCHNRGLLDGDLPGVLRWDDVLAFLDRRRGLLDAVVFSGGEPTLQAGLKQAVRAVRGMGFLVGIHTAGAFPETLRELLPHLDWVGMDIKAPFPDYQWVTGVPGSGEAAERSARLVRESGVSHRFRTTVDPCLVSDEQVAALRRLVVDEWGSGYDIQDVVALGGGEPKDGIASIRSHLSALRRPTSSDRTTRPKQTVTSVLYQATGSGGVFSHPIPENNATVGCQCGRKSGTVETETVVSWGSPARKRGSVPGKPLG